MYLKKIIAQGFKSFADKTIIDLTEGITGIVGPNGSGKSNVVDAIRWVLGEQSVKSLRGEGNMTDVIFQGSKSRNSSNVASVTLIFDNQDNYINLNFSEISIKRRVYRDGTNEYYLNGEQCRLKDITNILLDSGMAKESFNIISQGQIDDIVMSKPIDRRVMIEEAAGVLKYKRRKEDALRKLEKTNNNISRVNDIINELERQVEPLRREKEKALKHIDLSEELKSIEIALIAKDITSFNYKYQNKKEKIKELEKELLTINTSNTTNETKLIEYKMNLSRVEEKLKNAQQDLLNLTELTEKLNSQKKIILERKKYEVDDTKLHEELVSLKERELKLENELNVNKLDLENIEKKLSDYVDSENNILGRLDNEKKSKSLLQDKLTSLIRDNLSLKQKISYQKESIENNNALPSSVKNILNNPRLDGVHNVIGALIEVDEKYSKAISIALGGMVNNIVVDDEKCAKEAIRYLKENNLGRATFYPLSIIKPKKIDISIDGIIDVASNLVKYDKKYDNIIRNVLGNIVVVSDIDVANKVSKSIDYKYRVVTLDGEIIHVGGSITGGNEKKVTNVISLKYELEDNIKTFDSQENSIKEFENRINEIDYNLKSIEDELYLNNKEKINCLELKNTKIRQNVELNNLLEDVRKDLVGTNNILEGKLSAEEEQILKDYYEKVKEKDEVINLISTLSDEKETITEEKEQFEYKLKKENYVYNSKSKELKDLEIEVNRLDVRLDTLLNSLSENYNMTYEKATSLYKLELDEDLARSKVNNLKRELKDLGDVNLNAPREYDEVSGRYEFLISQREKTVL